MLEKTEMAIKNGQPRDTGNFGYYTQNEEETKKDNNTDAHQKTGSEPRLSGRVFNSCFLLDTLHVTHIVQNHKSFLMFKKTL